MQRNGRIFGLNTWFRFRDNFYGFGTTVEPIKKVVDSGMLGWPLTVTVGVATGFEWKFYWCGKTNRARTGPWRVSITTAGSAPRRSSPTIRTGCIKRSAAIGTMTGAVSATWSITWTRSSTSGRRHEPRRD